MLGVVTKIGVMFTRKKRINAFTANRVCLVYSIKCVSIAVATQSYLL